MIIKLNNNKYNDYILNNIIINIIICKKYINIKYFANIIVLTNIISLYL